MRLQTLVLLTATFLACLNVTSASTKLTAPEIPAQGRLFPANQRFLRIDEDEERVVDATKLETYKLQLNQFQLGDDLVTILKSPQVEKFSTFSRNRDPANQVSLIGKLSAKFGDDVVARTLVQLQRNGDDNPQFLAVLKQLREEQVTDWLKKDKTVPQVVTLLKLVDDETVFRGKALGMLEDYIKKVNAAKGGDESLLQSLTTFYGGESQLVAMITKAKYHPRSVEKAKELEFGDDVHQALSSGKVRIFAKYVSSRGSVLERLNAKYGEANVAAALATAKGNGATQGIATKLQQKQLSGWLSKGESLGKVFGFLKFKENDGLPQKLDTFDEYIKLLKTKNPQDETTVLTVLRKGFGEDEDQLALMFSKALRTPGSKPMESTITGYQNLVFKEWVTRDLDPMNVAVNVFKIPEATAGAAKYNSEIKWIIKHYTAFFKKETGLSMGPEFGNLSDTGTSIGKRPSGRQDPCKSASMCCSAPSASAPSSLNSSWSDHFPAL
ncbi:hypothetical protein V7S43_011852 [Phytophthora oleae]|uniref:RxLR effector protein n=1 Tax=Phytophthora oleae TaxID=2107226 RepID=A0ABD3FBL8_9STRA